MAQSLCPEDINWIRYLVHSYFHIVPIDMELDSRGVVNEIVIQVQGLGKRTSSRTPR